VYLADVARGIGGFALDGEAEGDRAGRSVSGAGDVNGDGIDDIIVGASGADANGSDSGRAYVVFGPADGSNVSLADVAQGIGGFVVDGQNERDFSGFSVSGAGDVNGDGLADVAVGRRIFEEGGPYDYGRVYVVLGKADTSAVQLADVVAGDGGFILDGDRWYYHLGYSVSRAGDVNADGLADVVVSPVEDGDVHVVFGRTGTDRVVLRDLADQGEGFTLDETTAQSAGAGDVNGDGLADLVVGGELRGYVVFGKVTSDTVSLNLVERGEGGFVLYREAGESSGVQTVSGAGDVNGDGLADVIMGASWVPAGGYSSGRAYVVFGREETDKVELGLVAAGDGGFSVDGVYELRMCGQSVSGAGDINGDGLSDVIVSTADVDVRGEDQPSRAYVVLGKESGRAVKLPDVARGKGGFILEGEEVVWGSPGLVVSSAGDVDDDGLPDVLVGAPFMSPNGEESGRAYVVYGSSFSCTEE
jgi:hypothetical protein